MAKETNKRTFVCLINKQSKILCVKRAEGTNNPGQWGLPGGHALEHETVLQAGRREVLEEIGLDIDFDRVSHIVHRADQKRTILFAKHPRVEDCEFDIDVTEVESIEYFSALDIARMDDSILHKSLQLALSPLLEVEPAIMANVLFTMQEEGVV